MMTIQLHPQLLIQFWLGAIVTMVTFWHIYTNLFPCDMKMNYYIICVNHLSNMDLYKKIYYLLNENTQWNINSVCCKSSDDLSFKVPDSLINEYFLSERYHGSFDSDRKYEETSIELFHFRARDSSTNHEEERIWLSSR